ncbi:MAG TPA: glycosyltransferase family 39 protein [Acidimicrobiales bacterium]|nr:glycosyltransferase family 39 protein [Acidimicrobiales bacterium]
MRVVTDRPAAGRPARAAARPVMVLTGAGGSLAPLAVAATAASTVLIGASLVLSRRTPMWLDEAQTMSIARQPLGQVLTALRGDGSPPLYYLLLHLWTGVFGDGDTAGRSLSAVLAVATVPVGVLAAARLYGRRAAVAAALLLVSLPFLHRYATEARMYSLVMLLSAAGILAVHQALERPGRWPLAAVAALTAALALTHYWALFLLAVVTTVVLACGLRHPAGDPGRAAAFRVVGAMAAGGVVFLPWAPTFLYQLRHTGAPWGQVAGLWIFESSLRSLAGDRGGLGLLGLAYPMLALLGLCAQPLPGGAIEIDPAGRPQARPMAAVVAGTLTLALVASRVTGSAFAPRYAAVVMVPFVLLAARGLAAVEHPRAVRIIAVALVSVGLFRSFEAADAPRTQARQVAAALDRRVQPGDAVVVCPDQLGPGLARELGPIAATTVVFPPGSSLERVDWVDYTERVHNSDPRAFARAIDLRAASSTIWMVTSPGYHGLEHSCERIFGTLHQLRPDPVRVVGAHAAYEHAQLYRFDPQR